MDLKKLKVGQAEVVALKKPDITKMMKHLSDCEQKVAMFTSDVEEVANDEDAGKKVDMVKSMKSKLMKHIKGAKEELENLEYELEQF